MYATILVGMILIVMAIVVGRSMVKSKARTEAKMRRGVAAAGPEIIAGMEDAPSPQKVILDDIDQKEKNLVAGVTEAVKRGNYKLGNEKALKRDSYHKSKERASSHYVERADDMVEHSMDDYDDRAAAIQRAKDSIANMPTVTRDQRMARGAAYTKAVALEFDKLYGRKA